MNKIAWQILLLQRHRGHGNNEWYIATNKIAWQMILLQRQRGRGNNERYLATNKFAWQMILLPRQDKRGNNVYSLATITFAWQMIYLPRHNGRGNNTLSNKIIAWQQKSIATLSLIVFTTSRYEDEHGKCSYCHANECCDNVLLQCLATLQEKLTLAMPN